MQEDAIAAAIAFEAIEIGTIVRFVMKDFRLSLPAGNHVIEGPGDSRRGLRAMPQRFRATRQ